MTPDELARSRMTPEEIARQEAQLRQFLHDHPMQSNEGISLAMDVKRADEARQQTDGAFGGQSWDDATNGYREQGAAGLNRGPVTLDQTNANQSRGLQMSALDLLRRQGAGTAPSSAAILSQRANQDAIRNAALQTTGAKSAGGAIAANRGAEDAAGQAMLAGNAQNANQRAAEVSRGLGAYAGGAGQMQGQDINAATTNAQLAAEQQALNEKRQQEFEQRAYATRKAQLDTGMQREQNYQGQIENVRAYNKGVAADTANTVGTVAAAGGAVMTGGTSAAALAGAKAAQHTMKSDERMKTHIGSLAGLMRGRR